MWWVFAERQVLGERGPNVTALSAGRRAVEDLWTGVLLNSCQHCLFPVLSSDLTRKALALVDNPSGVKPSEKARKERLIPPPHAHPNPLPSSPSEIPPSPLFIIRQLIPLLLLTLQINLKPSP